MTHADRFNQPRDRVVNGHHLADQMTPKSTLFPEGKMNNRDAGQQQGRKLSKKGRQVPAFSTSDEQEGHERYLAPPWACRTYSAGGSAKG
ncbi:MAG TPA: hypothetical protein VFR21_19865 [Bradyrhizobium sp.]|jgi:hypothetical protein|nr:hypothetical protein [Bradyrhizobium sp.]